MKPLNTHDLLWQQWRSGITPEQQELLNQLEPKGIIEMSKLQISSVILRMSRGGYPVEFHVQSSDIEAGLSMLEIETFLADCANNGYEPAYQFQKNDKKDVIGQRGMVKSVIATTSRKGTKLYEVTAILDDGGTEFKWNEFTPSAFRMNDRIEVIKNERGFTVGQLVSEESQNQNTLPL